MFYKQFFHMLIELNKIACICLKSFKVLEICFYNGTVWSLLEYRLSVTPVLPYKDRIVGE